MNISTETTTTPCVGGGQNSEKYWVGGSNLFPITRTKSIQTRRLNEFRSASIIAKNSTEGLPEEKNISLDKSKRKITLTSCIASIRSYMEDNRMETVFCVYVPHLKTEVYLLDDWVESEYGKVPK